MESSRRHRRPHRRLFCVLTLAVIAVGDRCLDSLLSMPGGEAGLSRRRRVQRAFGCAAAASPPSIPAASADGTGIARGPAKNAPPGPRDHLASLWTCWAVGRQRSQASASRQVGASIRAVVRRRCAASCGLVLRARGIAVAAMSGGSPPPGSSGRRRCRRDQPRSRTARPRRRRTAAAAPGSPPR